MAGQQGTSGKQETGRPEKRSRASALGEWIQTTQGLVTLIASILALVGGGASAAVLATGAGPGNTSSNHTPIVAVSTPSTFSTSTSASSGPTSGTISVFDGTTSTVQLMHALLLPQQALGSAASVDSSGDTIIMCGTILPSGAQAVAYETIRNSSTGQYLTESIIHWASVAGASAVVTEFRNQIDNINGCSISSNGITYQFDGNYNFVDGSPPPQCVNGKYDGTTLTTQPSVMSSGLAYSWGAESIVQCGSFTVAVKIISDSVGTSQHSSDGYLNLAVNNLEKALR